jgi:hypothetical protein
VADASSPSGGGPGAAEPVSWLQIAQGWTVVAADGAEVGSVETVTGDKQEDIFDGLAVGTASAGLRYVPAEQVGAISAGRVTLRISGAEVAALAPFREPPKETVWRPSPPSLRTRISNWIRGPR